MSFDGRENDIAARILDKGRVINVMKHQSRRLYRDNGYAKNANIWQYDPTPSSKAAGLPYQCLKYNIINGKAYNSKDITNINPELKNLPVFLKQKTKLAYPYEHSHYTTSHKNNNSISYSNKSFI